MIFHASTVHSSALTVYCMVSFPSVRPVYQLWQLAVRFYASWCIMQSRVGALANKKIIAMTEMAELKITC